MNELMRLSGGGLVPIEQVIGKLSEITDIEKADDFTKAVEAAKTFYSDSIREQNHFGEIAIWAERRLGQLIIEGQESGKIYDGKGRKKERSHDVTVKLADIGIEKMRSHRAQQFARISEEQIRGYTAGQREIEDEITKAGMLRFVVSGGNRATIFTGEVEWYTPTSYVESARKVMRGIDLDPASAALAQETVKAERFYDAVADGLTQPWEGRVFLNPPFRMPLIASFVERLCNEVQLGNVAQAVLLTNNCTDTAWWHRAAAAGRIALQPHTRPRHLFLEVAPQSGIPIASDPQRWPRLLSTVNTTESG